MKAKSNEWHRFHTASGLFIMRHYFPKKHKSLKIEKEEKTCKTFKLHVRYVEPPANRHVRVMLFHHTVRICIPSGEFDRLRLQCLLYQLWLLLYMNRQEACGCSSWRCSAYVLDVFKRTPPKSLHGSIEPRRDVAVCTHVHGLLLAPHNLRIYTVQTWQSRVLQSVSRINNVSQQLRKTNY